MNNYKDNSRNLVFAFTGIVLLLIGSSFWNQCEAQSKTLTQKEIDAIDVLYSDGLIEVTGVGWYVDPDLWKGMNFQQRKNFTWKLLVRYHQLAKTSRSSNWNITISNMATKKTMATWYEVRGYKEK